ncbi:MAG TPA: hypothetical protein VMA09_06385 [Candidatus Binataceae bacterium]|nr:hypothetical protein [Candidatus Binataceae bacterium]
MTPHQTEAGSQIEAAVLRAIEKVNELLPESQRLAKSRDTRLLDDGTELDSLSIVNLLVFVEDELSDSLGREISLTGSDDALDFPAEDLRSMGSLIEALQRRLFAQQ